jgi:membrane protein implicated in regulation of membrane protease activity
METMFLACFVFGALFTVASVVLGLAGSAMHGVHGGNGGHLGHGGDVAHGGDMGHAGADHGTGHDGAHDGPSRGLPLLNFSALLAFLTWFGAAGYLLTRFGAWPLILAVAAAVAAGAAGSMLIAFFLRRVMAGEQVLDPRDYRMVGTIARVTVTVPAGGAGEILFSKAGARRSEAARSAGGQMIPRDTEVVVLEYEHGIAAVQPWEEFMADTQSRAAEPGGAPAGRVEE